MSLMVWGCFWGHHRGPFVPLIVKSVNSYIYLQLREYLLPSVMRRIEVTLGDAVFMQDNAPIHKTGIVEE